MEKDQYQSVRVEGGTLQHVRALKSHKHQSSTRIEKVELVILSIYIYQCVNIFVYK